jgi:hypothetical protein
MQELFDTTQWSKASEAQQDKIVNAILGQLNGFEVAYAKTYSSTNPIRIVSLRERTTGIIFNLIPGGTFAMGFSELSLFCHLRRFPRNHALSAYEKSRF